MEVRDKIVEIVSFHSDVENVNQFLYEKDNLMQLGMNSMSFIKMVVALENEFHFEFEDDALDYKKFISINMLCDYVEKHIKSDNIIYSSEKSDENVDIIRNDLLKIICKCSDNPIINQPSFNSLMALNLSVSQIEKIKSAIYEQYGVALDKGTITSENLITIDNICAYIKKHI